MSTAPIRQTGRLPPLFARQARKSPSPARQRGVSLFITLLILMLTFVLVLGGLVVTNFNESIVGSQSDTQRTYGAAQALLAAAQRDIRLNGRDCGALAMGSAGTNSAIVQGAATACLLRFPRDQADYMQMLTDANVLGSVDSCSSQASFMGVCISSSPTSDPFAIPTVANGKTATGAQQWANGADYITFTKALDNKGSGVDYGGDAEAGNAALALTGASSRGKYWVEIFPYNIMSISIQGAGNVAVPDGSYPFIFRITAMAKGLKGGTVSVLRTYYVPYLMQPAP
ncbi:MAG: pilus assembly protein [Burkholderiaceae bacterium]|jgi:type IV pilus assembly protein PilX|nr:pilus assembly protein [Burkholderiaceae bacterium]